MKLLYVLDTELYDNMLSAILGIEPFTGTSASEKLNKKISDCSYIRINICIFLVFQIPVAGGVSAYEAVALYKGRRKIASKGDEGTKWRASQLVFYCACGITAGMVGGLLGLGGGFILGPLFLELGIPPQVHNF